MHDSRPTTSSNQKHLTSAYLEYKQLLLRGLVMKPSGDSVDVVGKHQKRSMFATGPLRQTSSHYK